MSHHGIPTKAYHAGLKQSLRDNIQSEWSNGITPVLAATISFGMGIDKSDVRWASKKIGLILLNIYYIAK